MFPHKYTSAADIPATAKWLARLAVPNIARDMPKFIEVAKDNPARKHPHSNDPRVIREFSALVDYVLENKLHLD